MKIPMLLLKWQKIIVAYFYLQLPPTQLLPKIMTIIPIKNSQIWTSKFWGRNDYKVNLSENVKNILSLLKNYARISVYLD